MTIPIESALMAATRCSSWAASVSPLSRWNNDAGLQFMENATKAIEDLKAAGTACETVATETFNEGESERLQRHGIKDQGRQSDVIVVNMGYVECAAILNQARQAGLTDVKWLGNQSMYTEDFTNLVGDAGVGFHVSTGFYAANPDAGVQEFIEQCKAIDGNVPNAYQRNSYECAAMIAQCLKDGAGNPPGALRRAGGHGALGRQDRRKQVDQPPVRGRVPDSPVPGGRRVEDAGTEQIGI